MLITNIIYNINDVVKIVYQKIELKEKKINLSKCRISSKHYDKNNVNLIKMKRKWLLYGKNIIGAKKLKYEYI